MWLAKLLTGYNNNEGSVEGPFLCPGESALAALFGHGISGTVLLKSAYQKLK